MSINEEQQREQRHAVGRKGLIGRKGKVLAAEIINVSENGMSIRTGCSLLVGQKLDVFCGGFTSLGSTVIWVKDGAAGLRLTAPVSYREFEEAVNQRSPPLKTLSVGARLALAFRPRLGRLA
ncbi:MAG: PilZ domain-containing protein [Caulobacteraceae bacterium]